jgi:hypothetical protein
VPPIFSVRDVAGRVLLLAQQRHGAVGDEVTNHRLGPQLHILNANVEAAHGATLCRFYKADLQESGSG